eukprot:TRINITY_DN3178_c0_g1_i1.p1 TRINITY_DN3178_c0_g1~~TRINITY_DN3178_c0_g1_i1.p1  ORF type:complete len:219 (-),score=37.65 TRINITY_DN3178_c0_g1_i1:28-684(-)
MLASFQLPEKGLEHQIDMPVVPQPQELLTREDRMKLVSENPETPDALRWLIRKQLGTPFPVDIRYVKPPSDPLRVEKSPPHQSMWMKTHELLSDEPQIHNAAAAYFSDMSLLETSTLPHGISFFSGKLQIASLDHSMWFHAPFRADDWLLYTMDSSRSAAGRGLSFGRFYTTDGRLVISTAQEGLIRVIDDAPPMYKQITDRNRPEKSKEKDGAKAKL